MNEYERAPVAERIRQARSRSGVSVAALCQALEVSDDAYRDLESCDDEAFMSVSLHQLCSCADLLGVRPDELVAPPGFSASRTVSLTKLMGLVAEAMRDRGETSEGFSDRVGWDVTGALADPGTAWRDWNVDCLQDVTRAVGLRWLDVLASWPAERVA